MVYTSNALEINQISAAGLKPNRHFNSHPSAGTGYAHDFPDHSGDIAGMLQGMSRIDYIKHTVREFHVMHIHDQDIRLLAKQVDPHNPLCPAQPEVIQLSDAPAPHAQYRPRVTLEPGQSVIGKYLRPRQQGLLASRERSLPLQAQIVTVRLVTPQTEPPQTQLMLPGCQARTHSPLAIILVAGQPPGCCRTSPYGTGAPSARPGGAPHRSAGPGLCCSGRSRRTAGRTAPAARTAT